MLRTRRHFLVLALVTWALASLAPGAQARPREYLASISGAESYSAYSEWKRWDTASCDITDISKVSYQAAFHSRLPVVVEVDLQNPDLFSPSEMPIRVEQERILRDSYDHEPETGGCGADAKEPPDTCKKVANGTASLFADTAVVAQNGAADDFTNAPDTLTVTGDIPYARDCFQQPGFWVRDFYPRRFLPATSGRQKTSILVDRRTDEVILRGQRQMLETGQSGTPEDPSGEWNAGWSTHWKLTLVKNR